jgi:segregation and condensation protein B
METLAIVAYRQPILRADIEGIRGVSCEEILRQLMDRDLVRIGGRSEELGRPYLYATTKSFLRVFGLESLDSLPRVGALKSPAEPAAVGNVQPTVVESLSGDLRVISSEEESGMRVSALSDRELGGFRHAAIESDQVVDPRLAQAAEADEEEEGDEEEEDDDYEDEEEEEDDYEDFDDMDLDEDFDEEEEEDEDEDLEDEWEEVEEDEEEEEDVEDEEDWDEDEEEEEEEEEDFE